MAEVLRHPSLLRRVVHDVMGDWQFLDEEDVGHREPNLVCLADIVALEPSIAELADLPLGWCATRQSAQRAWDRKPMVPLAWDELLSTATEYAQGCQARLESEFNASKWERYDLDPENAQFTFLSQGVVRVRADMCVAGTLSLTEGTWLWSWANADVPKPARRDVEWLAAFGSENDIKQLVEPKQLAEEVDAWELASVACFLLEAHGIYRAPREQMHAFLLLDDLRWAAA